MKTLTDFLKTVKTGVDPRLEYPSYWQNTLHQFQKLEFFLDLLKAIIPLLITALDWNDFYNKMKILIPNIIQLPVNVLINELMNTSYYYINLQFM